MKVFDLKENYDIATLEKGLSDLFAENLYKLFNELLTKRENTFVPVIGNFYRNSVLIKVSEKCSDLNEIIQIAIKDRNTIILSQALILLTSLRGEEFIRSENFLLLTAEYDCSGDIFEILDKHNLALLSDFSKETIETILKRSTQNNNYHFLSKFLTKLLVNKEAKNCITEELIKLSTKNVECFKIIYEKDLKKEWIGDDVLKHCLDNEYKETFIWMLNQFENFIEGDKNSQESDECKLLYRNIKWKSNTKDSIYTTVLLKSKKNDEFFRNMAKEIFEKMFILENKLSSRRLKEKKK